MRGICLRLPFLAAIPSVQSSSNEKFGNKGNVPERLSDYCVVACEKPLFLGRNQVFALYSPHETLYLK